MQSVKSPRRYPVVRTCGNCKWCYEQDPFEMDGLCKKQCSYQDNRNYTLLDFPGCQDWENAERAENESFLLTK